MPTASCLFETGKPGPGMFVVLSGHVAITQRDGLGHVTPVIDQGPGQFLAEVGQLSGRPALVDGHAEGEVEVILVPPEGLRRLLVAEAELGERITRALILRRVEPDPERRGRPGADRLAAIRSDRAAAEFPRPQRPALSPHRPDRRTMKRGSSSSAMRPDPAGPAAGRHAGRLGPAQSQRAGPRPRRRHARHHGAQGPLRRRGRRRRAGRSRDRRLCRVGGAQRLRRRFSAPMAARPEPGPHRELSRLSDRYLRAGARRPRLRPGAEIRRRHAHPGRGAALDCAKSDGAFALDMRDDGRVRARAIVIASGARYRRPGHGRSRPASKAGAYGTGPRRSRPSSAPARRSSSSAAAIRPARRRCSWPGMPGKSA